MPARPADPPAAQSQVVTIAGRNQAARVGAYTDPHLTMRAVAGVAAPSDLPAKTGSASLGNTRAMYAADRKTTIQGTAKTLNAGLAAPPRSPNSWFMGTVNGRRVSRDMYANQGMVGQSYFNNTNG